MTLANILGMEANMSKGSIELRESLSAVFGSEWFALSRDDKALIIRDCTEEGGVTNFRQYQRNIGTGNLLSYVKTQRIRFREGK